MKPFFAFAILFSALLAVTGCITTTLEDGTQITRLDTETIIALYPLVDSLLSRLDNNDDSVDQDRSGLEAWAFMLLDTNSDGTLTRNETLTNIGLLADELQRRGVDAKSLGAQK